MTRSKTTGQEEEFLKAAWGVIREVEKELEVSIDIELVPQQQKGRFLIYLIATDMQAGLHFNGVIARYRREFPNGQNTTLAGSLFAGALQLDKLIYDARTSEAERPSST